MRGRVIGRNIVAKQDALMGTLHTAVRLGYRVVSAAQELKRHFSRRIERTDQMTFIHIFIVAVVG